MTTLNSIERSEQIINLLNDGQSIYYPPDDEEWNVIKKIVEMNLAKVGKELRIVEESLDDPENSRIKTPMLSISIKKHK